MNNGGGSHSGQVKLSATRKSYGDLPASGSPNHFRPQPPPTARKPRPVSDGIALSGSFQPPFHNSNSTGPPIAAATTPTGGYKGREEGGVRLQQRPLQLPHLPLSLIFIYPSVVPPYFDLSRRRLWPFTPTATFSLFHFMSVYFTCENSPSVQSDSVRYVRFYVGSSFTSR